MLTAVSDRPAWGLQPFCLHGFENILIKPSRRQPVVAGFPARSLCPGGVPECSDAGAGGSASLEPWVCGPAG